MNKQFGKVVFGIILPIVIGALIYFWMSPNTYFVKLFWSLLDISNPFEGFSISNACIILRLIRFYFCDFLWAFAFTNVLIISMNNDSIKGDILTFLLSILFFGVIETLQMINSFLGTFDIIDFLVESAACIILIIFTRLGRIRNEKKNY